MSEPIPVPVPAWPVQTDQRAALAVDTTTRAVVIVAPCDLPEGFVLHVVEGHQSTCQVQVPPGGVRGGQQFAALVVGAQLQGNHNIPHGKFRDGICDCCILGCCHPLCWMSCWCKACALGQVLSRMRLSWFANEVPEGFGYSAFWFYFMVQIAIALFFMIIRTLVAFYYSLFWIPGFDGILYAAAAMRFLYWLLLLTVTIKLRGYVRAKYQIPEVCCGGCDDFCCAFWCMPCTICQLARHTADYRKFNGACCTEKRTYKWISLCSLNVVYSSLTIW